MMDRRSLRIAATLAAIALTTAFAAAQDAPATQPTPADAQAARTVRTERDEIADVLAFELKFVVDAYKQHGRRDPRWDADAVKLIEAQVRASRHDRADRFYRSPDVMPAADRAALATRVIEAGCDDAIVLYEAGCALKAAADATRDAARAGATVTIGFERPDLGGGSPAQAFAAAARVAAASPYASIYKFVIARAALDGGALAAKAEEAAAAQAMLESSLKACLTDRTTLPAHRLAVWIVGREAFSPKQPGGGRELALANGKVIDGLEGGDPWLYHLVLGIVEIDRAWESRGGGYANTVTDDGWKGFKTHLVAATGHFQRAIEADDTLPQPFSQMVTVAKGESSDTARAWFEHAVARQVDFTPALFNYAEALEPKWGGTPLAMFEEGVRAVDTGRFDTRRPAMLLDLLKRVDDNEPLDARQLARVYPQVVRCLDGYIAQSPLDEVKRWARSTRAAWAVRAERWAEANEQFAALAAAGQAVDQSAFYEFNLRVADATAEAAARGGPRAADVAAALAKPVAERPIALDAIVKSLAADDAARPWVRQRLYDAQLAAAMAGGDWAPLPIAADLDGWTTAGEAKWTLEPDGSLVCGPYEAPPRPATPAEPQVPPLPSANQPEARAAAIARMRERMARGAVSGPSIAAPFEMPAAFELRFTVAPLAPQPKANAFPAVGVAPVGLTGQRMGGTVGWVTLHPGRGEGFVAGQRGGKFPAPEAGDGSITVTLRVRNGGIGVLGPDGEPLIEAGGDEGIIRGAGGNVEGTIEMGSAGLIIRDQNGRLVTMPDPRGGILGAPSSPGAPAASTRRIRFGSPSAAPSAGWRFSRIEIRAIDPARK